jgi:hypothetical protein
MGTIHTIVNPDIVRKKKVAERGARRIKTNTKDF